MTVLDRCLSAKFVLALLASLLIFPAGGFCMDPVSPTCEANLSPAQIGLVLGWNNYSSIVFGHKYRSGRYLARYKKYSYPYLYGFKLGRENMFDPDKHSLLAAAASGDYLLVEDTLITPSVSVGSEMYYARNAEKDSVTEWEFNALFSKELTGIMPYLGPAVKYAKLKAGGVSEDKWGSNLKTGLKFYTYPGVSYGVEFTLGRLGGWGLYFNNSW